MSYVQDVKKSSWIKYTCILWGALIDISGDVLVNMAVITRSALDQPIHQFAICREFILVKHPPMSANILTVILLVAVSAEAYESTTGQLPAVYWSTVGPVSVDSREIVDR